MEQDSAPEQQRLDKLTEGNTFRPLVPRSAFLEEDWLQAEALHRELTREDGEPMRLYMARDFHAYIQQCDLRSCDETLERTTPGRPSIPELRIRWLSESYVPNLREFIQQKKHEFTLATCLASVGAQRRPIWSRHHRQLHTRRSRSQLVGVPLFNGTSSLCGRQGVSCSTTLLCPQEASSFTPIA